MPDQFQNEKQVELEDTIVPEAAEKDKVERVADKAARKASETVKQYEKEQPIFSK
jgi:hypothetical protein